MLTPRDGRQEPKGIAGAWRYACPCDRSRMSLDTAPELLTFVLHPIAAFHFTCCLTISSGDHGSPLLSGTKSPTSVRFQRATNRLDQVLTRHNATDLWAERHGFAAAVVVLALEMRGFWASGVAPISVQPEAACAVVKPQHVPYMFY